MKKSKTASKAANPVATVESTALSNSVLFLLAFIEGAMVISVELLGSKMIAAFFGGSLKVWTAVICVTITFLTIGYFIGGRMSRSGQLADKLVHLLALSAIGMILMPESALYLFGKLGSGALYGGTIMTSILLIGPPVLLLGITSPIIIRLMNKEVQSSGFTAGKVYAVSTVSGILLTLLTGFWFLPQFGITKPLILLAAILMITPFIVRFKKVLFVYTILFVVLLFNTLNTDRDLTGTDQYKKYQMIDEGFLGQLKVLDESYPISYSKDRFRSLIINGILQSGIYNDQKAVSYWAYVHKIAMTASLVKGKNALLIGMGGGSVATELSKSGFKTDIVDIDERMLDVAKRFFYFKDTACTFTEDDARHYFNVCTKKYDLIVLDICSGEVQPTNVFTLEGIARIKKILKPDGIILVQYQEALDPERISGSQSISNTFMAQGFNVYRNIEPGEIAGVILLATQNKMDFSNIDASRFRSYNRVVSNLNVDEFLKKPFDSCPKPFEKGIILTDDRPMLEVLNDETIRIWRKRMIEHYGLTHLQQRKRFFR